MQLGLWVPFKKDSNEELVCVHLKHWWLCMFVFMFPIVFDCDIHYVCPPGCGQDLVAF